MYVFSYVAIEYSMPGSFKGDTTTARSLAIFTYSLTHIHWLVGGSYTHLLESLQSLNPLESTIPYSFASIQSAINLHMIGLRRLVLSLAVLCIMWN